jgi:hypothetical protein
MPTMTPRMSARISAVMTTWSVCPIVRSMSGQIGCRVTSDLPSLCSKTSCTQYQYRTGIDRFRWNWYLRLLRVSCEMFGWMRSCPSGSPPSETNVKLRKLEMISTGML